MLRFHLLSFPSGSVIRFRLRSFRLSSAERLLHSWAWTFSSVLTYPVSPAFEHLFSASGRALTLKPLFFAWLLPLPIELVSCRFYLPLSPLWLGLTAFSYIPQLVTKSESLRMLDPHVFLPSLLLGAVLSRLCGWSCY